jgi:hypothetical protein
MTVTLLIRYRGPCTPICMFLCFLNLFTSLILEWAVEFFRSFFFALKKLLSSLFFAGLIYRFVSDCDQTVVAAVDCNIFQVQRISSNLGEFMKLI